jgi:hypothetical protein
MISGTHRIGRWKVSAGHNVHCQIQATTLAKSAADVWRGQRHLAVDPHALHLPPLLLPAATAALALVIAHRHGRRGRRPAAGAASGGGGGDAEAAAQIRGRGGSGGGGGGVVSRGSLPAPTEDGAVGQFCVQKVANSAGKQLLQFMRHNQLTAANTLFRPRRRRRRRRNRYAHPGNVTYRPRGGKNGCDAQIDYGKSLGWESTTELSSHF